MYVCIDTMLRGTHLYVLIGFQYRKVSKTKMWKLDNTAVYHGVHFGNEKNKEETDTEHDPVSTSRLPLKYTPAAYVTKKNGKKTEKKTVGCFPV